MRVEGSTKNMRVPVAIFAIVLRHSYNRTPNMSLDHFKDTGARSSDIRGSARVSNAS